MNFNNWQYINDKNGARIIPSKEISYPRSFIKYYGLNDNSVNALTNKYLFFSHPLILNDPFDSCRQLISLDKFSERQFVKLHEQNQNFVTPNQVFSIEKIKSRTAKWYREDKTDLADSYLTLFWNLIFKDWGILSLAGVDNDMLMWSYYNNHQGFVLEFDSALYNNKNVIGAFPINYTNNYETIFPRSIKLNLEHILYTTNVKSLQWSHEREWRFLVNKEDMSIPHYDDPILKADKRKIYYKAEKVKSIILGYKFFEDNITKTHFRKGKRLFKFQPDKNKKDVLRLKIINFILDNNIKVREIEISEDNTFTLNVMNISLICKQKGIEYFVESEYLKAPNS